jgi:hypothetical protein
VYVFEVATKVTALSKSLTTFWACKRPLSCVLSKMVAKVTAFLKN